MSKIFDQSVNGFIFPNSIIDELLADLSHSELKCYLVVLRKTKGWNKEEDYISVSQFMKVTGLSNRSVINACESLVARGILERKTGERNTSIYSIKTYSQSTSEKSSLVKNFPSTREKTSPVTSEKSSHTKDNIKNNITNNPPISPQGEVKPKRNLKRVAKKFNPEIVELPSYVDRKAWIGYCQMREAKGKPVNAMSVVEVCLKRLEKHSKGNLQLAIDILERSTELGWTGLFALDDSNKSSSKPNAHSGFAEKQYQPAGTKQVMPDWALTD